MDIDENDAESPAIARPEEPHQHDTAGAAPNMSSPPRAGLQRPRTEVASLADAPTRSISRSSDDEVLDYTSTDSAGAAGASGTQSALTQMMSEAVGAPRNALSVAAKKRLDTAAKKATKAEARKAAAQKKRAPQAGAAGAAPHPDTQLTGTALPRIVEDAPATQHMPPGQLDSVAYPPLRTLIAPNIAPNMETLNKVSQQMTPPLTTSAPNSSVASETPSRVMSPRHLQGNQVWKPTPPRPRHPPAQAHPRDRTWLHTDADADECVTREIYNLRNP
jgi:hypothetical protein